MIFFQMISPNISIDNINILYQYLLQHQERLIQNIYNIFGNDEEIQEFLEKISPHEIFLFIRIFNQKSLTQIKQ